MDFETAAKAFREQFHDGLGIALGEVPGEDLVVAGIDLDGIDPLTDEKAQQIILAADSYTELSPSGRGLHIVGTVRTTSSAVSQAGLEIYTGKRYFTVTGERLNQASIADITDAITLAKTLHGYKNGSGGQPVIQSRDGKIIDGNRHNACKSRAAAIANRSLSFDELNGALQGWNLAACADPLPEDEVRDLAQWAWNKAQELPMTPRAAREMTEPQPDPNEDMVVAPTLKGINFADMDPHLFDGYLVKGVLPREGEASIIGASGSGKTFLATDLALHIAADRPWRGIRVKGGLVVYVGAESPRSVERRFFAARHAGTFPSSTAIKLTPGPINMLDDASVTSLIEFCQGAELEFGKKCVAVFIDTLARSMSGGEENSNDTMSQVTRTGCDRIRDELKATVIVIHHMGKDLERGSRGGSAFPAAMDAEISVSEEQEQRIATIKKSRDGKDGERYGFKLKIVDLGLDEDGEQVTSCLIEHIGATELKMRKPSGKFQLQLLTELEKRTELEPSIVWTEPELREIARDIGQNKNTAREAVFGLKRLGYFIPSIGGSRLNYAPGKKE